MVSVQVCVFCDTASLSILNQGMYSSLVGASVGRGVAIKPRVNIQFPVEAVHRRLHLDWRGGFHLELRPVNIGAHCCISQRAFLCAGNHDFRQLDMPYRNRAIVIEDGAWVGAQAFVSPNVTIGWNRSLPLVPS